jgi:glycosyltransferase involved in cell wall biosynthesis
MNTSEEPFVSVLTPVYNGEEYVAECIESVLRQTYKRFEYLIVNNCSTDRTLEIALSYARRDSRINVQTNKAFVGVIENHNHAFTQISPAAKYCKVVSADDTIFPDCLRQLVETAESHPSAGMIGCYQQSGKMVRWQGFPYPQILVAGREVCRQIFLGGNPAFGFGTPTSLLYRADLVRRSVRFYPNASPHADSSACFNVLKESDFAFVYQVLCWERTHEQTQTSQSGTINRYSSAYLNDVLQYGPIYLDKSEYQRVLRGALRQYREFLAVNLFRSRGKEFWDYHRSRLNELGFPINPLVLCLAGMRKLLLELLNPEQALRKFWSHYVRRDGIH